MCDNILNKIDIDIGCTRYYISQYILFVLWFCGYKETSTNRIQKQQSAEHLQTDKALENDKFN